MFDIVTIGGSTRDIFISMNSAEVIDMKKYADRKSLLCLNYGEKIEVDKLSYDIGGGSVNTSVNFAHLGLKTAAIIKIGDDSNGYEVVQRLKKKNVDTSMVIKTEEYNTGSSFIITSFEGERTVMMERGANSKIVKNEIDWECLKNTKYIYLSSLSGDSNKVVADIINFAKDNDIKLAINPGKAQIKNGLESFQNFLKNVDILILNKVEAMMLTGMTEKYEECSEVNAENDLSFDFSAPKTSNLDDIFIKLKSFGPRIVVITEGQKGCQAFDGETFYFAPIFPLKAVSTLGAGDAFSSTFVASLIRHDYDVNRSLAYASINSAFVVQDMSAHLAVKTFDELESILTKNPNYKIFNRTQKEAVTIG